MPQFSLFTIDDSGKVRTDRKCSSCRLASNSKLQTNCMSGTGPVGAELFFVGHSPGKEDDGIGRPMTGENGRLFRELLKEAGIDENTVYVTNCVKCCDHDTGLDDRIWKSCRNYLFQEINRIKPKIVISVGAKAREWLTGSKKGTRESSLYTLPLLGMKEYLVFAIEQPILLHHILGPLKAGKRRKMVENLKWIKNQVESGLLTKEPDPVDYKIAKTLQDVRDFLDELDDVDEVACDLETGNEKKPALFPGPGVYIKAIGFSKGPRHARAIPYLSTGDFKTVWYWEEKELEQIHIWLKEFLLTHSVYGHNFLQFDQKWIKYTFGIDRCDVHFDTMLAHYLLNEEKGTHDLEQLAAEFGDMVPWKKTFQLKDTNKLCEYLCKDVDATSRIRDKFEELLTPKLEKLLHELLIPLGHELMEMEYRGVYINQDGLNHLDHTLCGKIDQTLAELRKIQEVKEFEFTKNTTFNCDSPSHIRVVMRDLLHLPPVKLTAGNKEYCTDHEVLEYYKEEPFVAGVLELRKLGRLKGTFCDGIRSRIEHDGCIHTSFLIHGTETGRLSSQNPNLQNIPREGTSEKVLEDPKVVKACFGARGEDRCFIQCDLSQIEYRTLAALSGDPVMIQAFIDKKDFHKATAAKMFGKEYNKVTKEERNLSKEVNFGIIYGKSLTSLIRVFKEKGASEETAKNFYYSHQKEFPRAWAWMAEQEKQIREHMYQEFWTGRRRRYTILDDHTIRQGYNSPVQGGASELTLYNIVRCGKMLREENLDAFQVLTVHDSIAFDSHLECAWEVIDKTKSIIENPGFTFLGNVPIKVDYNIGLTWGHMFEVDVDKHLIIRNE